MGQPPTNGGGPPSVRSLPDSVPASSGQHFRWRHGHPRLNSIQLKGLISMGLNGYA